MNSLRRVARNLTNRLLVGLRRRGLGSRLLSGFLLVVLLPTIALCSIALVISRLFILR